MAMISCTEFIPAYSELFTYLDGLGGDEAVEDYWEYITGNALDGLAKAVEAEGVKGCYTYFSKNLNEEAADFTMTYDEDTDTYECVMHHCPSMGRLLEYKQLVPYRNYCGHCSWIYAGVLEKMGYHYEMDISHADEARCIERVTRKEKQA